LVRSVIPGYIAKTLFSITQPGTLFFAKGGFKTTQCGEWW